MPPTTMPTSTVAPTTNNVSSLCSWHYDQAALNVLGLIGAVSVLALWLAPIRDIWSGSDSVWASKSTQRVATGFPYIASIFNCILWEIYSFSDPGKFLVPLFVNLAGFLLNTSFIWCWYRYADESGKHKTKQEMGGFVVFSMFAMVLWAISGDIEIEGYCAAFVNTLMLFGPLAAAGQVIKTRSVKGMPLLPLIFTVIASVIWSGYGLYICTIQVMIPNGLGIICGLLQLTLYFWARHHERKNQLLAEEDSFRATTPMGTSRLDEEGRSDRGMSLDDGGVGLRV